MRLHDQVLSEEDFEQLPPALRRKCFSSLERLRLAQDASNGISSTSGLRHSFFIRRSSTSHHSSTRKQSVSSAASIHRSLSAVGLPHSRQRSRLRKASCPLISPSRTLISPWEFAALPVAVQRKHFSAEEQHHIGSRINPVILDAADEALLKQYQQSQRASIPSTYGRDWVEPEDTVCEDEHEHEAELEASDMDVKDLESFRWLDNSNEIDLRLDDYHTISAGLNNNHSCTAPRRRSFRRGLSFSNVSFGRRSSSSTSLQSPNISSMHNKPMPTPVTNFPPSAHKRLDSNASLDPSATHYQDPAAKMKLRVYLASPQKFDEALEFGFPALHKEVPQPPACPKSSAGQVSGQSKTFFADDTPSLSEDESREELSDNTYQDSPRTPIDMSFPAGKSHKTSTDRSTSLRPRVMHNIAESYAHAPASDREMTLRMTLTKPELRVLEETDHARPPLVNETPLEKPPLAVSMGGIGSIWDELPPETSRMKRLFNRLKGKS